MTTPTPDLSFSRTRRLMLQAFSASPMLGLGLATLPRGAGADELACTLAPTMTQGPYWVDEKLYRSDITTGTSRASVADGLPFTLSLAFYRAAADACGTVPAADVQIDIWHADAAGEYSDVSGNGQNDTRGETFLRGYQFTDSNGQVTFTTIYPGWYSGRTAHIHVRARAYDTAGNTTYDFTTQLFFDDTITHVVYQIPPYSARPNRDTVNGTDMHYRSVATPILLALSGDTTSGLKGEASIGLAGLPASLSTPGGSFSAVTTATGSAAMPTLTTTISIAAADESGNGNTYIAGNIYIAANLAGNWYFNNGQAWIPIADMGVDSVPAFYSGVLGSHSFTILSGIDITDWPKVMFYAGYGANVQDMLLKSQYRLTYTLGA